MANTLYVVVYDSALAEPSAAQIKAGQDVNSAAADFATSAAWTGAGQQVTASGLTSGGYKASAVVSDGVTDSNVVTSSIWYAVAAASASFTFTGNATAFAVAHKIAADSGAFTLTGVSAGLRRDYTLAAEVGTFTLTGIDTAFAVAHKIAADVGTFSLTGSDATLTYTPAGGAYTLTADSGAFSLTGIAANLAYGRLPLTADSVSFTLTGQDAALSRTWALVAEPGSFVLTGNDAGLSTTGTAEVVAPKTGAGKPKRTRKRRYTVEVDGEEFDVSSPAEAEAVLKQIREQAEQQAEAVIERANKAVKRPKRKVVQDARKALQVPTIQAPDFLAEAVANTLNEIRSLYESTIQTVEIGALMRRIEDEDEEEALLMLL